MTAGAPATNERRLDRMQAEIAPLGSLAFVGLFLLLEASVWGQWGKLALGAALFVESFVFNTPVCTWLRNRFGVRTGEWLRMGHNLINAWALCHLAGWPVAGWAMFILTGSIQGVADNPGSGWHNATLAAGLLAGSLWDGAAPLSALSAAGAVLGGFWLVHQTARIGTQSLIQLGEQHRALEQAHAELRRVQETAVAQEKLAGLGLLAAGVAHEINNPMAYVTSNVASLLEDLRALPALPEPLREYVDEVLPDTLDGIRRVNTIVGDLRSFARGDPEGRHEFDLNDEIDHALRIAHSRIGERCRVERHLGELAKLVGRPQQIVQVLVNLFVNAAQAMKQGGVLEVTTRQVGGEARLEVRDSGAGMDSETQRHLFEPFFTTKPQGEGTGLGLSVAHGIVTSHGGRIDVESEPGHGSCFTIHLPLAQPPPSSLVRPAAAHPKLAPVAGTA
ncbi:MAG: sensor histidine kinase [Myxococcales bacterium]